MAEKTVPATAENGQIASTRENSRFLIPPVDIYETKDSLEVVADLPGVEKDDIEIRVDNGLLTFQAKIKHVLQGEAIYTEYSLMDYYRQFQLGEVIDQDHIGADLKNGVLTIHLPKVEKAKPRQIQVKVA